MCIFLKFSKIHKNYTVGLIFRRGIWEHLGMTSGAPQGCTPPAGAAKGRGARHPVVWAPPCPTTSSLPPISLSLPKKLVLTFSHSRFCSRAQDLDLFAQARFMSEIWHISSPVCDSSDYPSRILFGWVYLEYFAAVGNMFSELACLF